MNNPRRANSARRNHMRERLIKAGNTCGICGKPIDTSRHWPDPLSPVIDEIIPISQGGSLTYSNSQLAHAYCNRIKSNKSQTWAQHQLANTTQANPIPAKKQANHPSSW